MSDNRDTSSVSDLDPKDPVVIQAVIEVYRDALREAGWPTGDRAVLACRQTFDDDWAEGQLQAGGDPYEAMVAELVSLRGKLKEAGLRPVEGGFEVLH